MQYIDSTVRFYTLFFLIVIITFATTHFLINKFLYLYQTHVSQTIKNIVNVVFKTIFSAIIASITLIIVLIITKDIWAVGV